MVWAKAGAGERGGGVNNIAIGGFSGAARGCFSSYVACSARTSGTWALLVDGLVEVEAEAVGGDEEEDAHLLAAVVVDA